MLDAEQSVGITEVLGHHSGFSGLLKHRWDDFHVHEVDEDGHIRHLTELISRSEIIETMKSQRVVDSGEGTFTQDFEFDDISKRILFDGFLSNRDISVLELFIQSLSRVADPPRLTQQHDTLSQDSQKGEADEDISQSDIPTILKDKVTLKSPPFCVILGDFERCLRSMIEKDPKNKPTENQIWKELRRCVHLTIRQLLPFLCSDTLTLNELSSLISSFPDTLTEIYLPTTRQTFVKPNRLVEEILEEYRHQVNALVKESQLPTDSLPPGSLYPIDQLKRFIRLSPKPPCLSLLFHHLRREPRDHQKERGKAPKDGCNAVLLGTRPPKIASKDVASGDVGSEDIQSKEDVGGEDVGDASNSDVKIEKKDGETSMDSIPGKKNNYCDCKRKKRRGGQWRKNQLSINANGVCTHCQGLAREPRLASHFDRWPKDRPPYLRFHLWKSNRDTAEALGVIAQCLGCHIKNLSFAGTKDRRGITVQAVTVPKISILQMHKALVNPRWDRSLRVSDLQYTKHRMTLGSLQGNHFRICLRNVDPKNEENVKIACDSLKEIGFINYFGLQRFGTRYVKTHEVGASILRKDFRGAVRQILGDSTVTKETPTTSTSPSSAIQAQQLKKKRVIVEPNETEKFSKRMKVEEQLLNNCCSSREDILPKDDADITIPDVNHTSNQKEGIETPEEFSPRQEALCRSPCALYLATGNALKNLKTLPRHCYVERQLLQYLGAHPNAFLEALLQLPKNTLTLYIHAVQSLIWNAVVSYRLRHFGKHPILNDFVLKNGSSSSSESKLVETKNEEHERTAAEDIEDAEDADSYSATQFEVKVLRTDEDVQNATLYDIVLPVPGDHVEYPSYLRPIYEQYCYEYFRLHLEDIQSNKKNGIGEFSGGYRHVCIRPKDFRYHFIPNVKNGTEKLLASDVDRLLDNPIAKTDPLGDPSFIPTKVIIPSPCKMDQSIEHDEFTGTAAVLLSCTLPKSAYLTMACRELFMA